MLIKKTNPVGIDVNIQRLQEQLHKRLMTAWSLDTNDADDNKQYQCYGRAYRNKSGNGYTAEVFTGDTTAATKEYKEVYFNDEIAAISWFGLGEKINFDKLNKAEAHLVFFVDLEKLAIKDKDGAAVKHRADEEIRQLVQSIVQSYGNGFTVESIELGLTNALREYAGSYRDERLKKADMQPAHCFRLNLQIFYDFKQEC